MSTSLDRGSRPLGYHGSGERPHGPADHRSSNGDDGGLHAREERELPAPCSEPSEPLPGGVRVPAHADGSEDGESEEECGGLTADEEEPPTRHVARLGSRPELLDRGGELEGARRRLQLRPGAGDVPRETVDLPGSQRARLQRRHPGIAAVGTFERGRRREPVNPFGQHERRRLRPVVLEGLPVDGAQSRAAPLVLRGGDEVAEEDRRRDDRLPDLHQAEAGDVRDASATAQPDDLAVVRLAGLRQAARAERHPVREPLDAAEAEKGPCDRALAEEDEPRRLRRDDVGERVCRRAFENGRVFLGTRDPEPGGADCALGGGNLLDRPADALVAGDDRACENRRQHRRPGCHSGACEERGRRPPGDPDRGEPERIGEPAQRVHDCTLPVADALDHSRCFGYG